MIRQRPDVEQVRERTFVAGWESDAFGLRGTFPSSPPPSPFFQKNNKNLSIRKIEKIHCFYAFETNLLDSEIDHYL